MNASVRPFKGIHPKIASGVYIADTARVIGDVELGADASIWFGSVLRGDVGAIRVGARSNIQDLSMLHMSLGISSTVIGEEVTVGHGVIIHGALIGDGALFEGAISRCGLRVPWSVVTMRRSLIVVPETLLPA